MPTLHHGEKGQMTRTIRDSRQVAKRLIREMEQGSQISDPAGAEIWKWSAVDDYAQLLRDAASITPEEFEMRQESVNIYAAKAESAGVSAEWLEVQFYRVRREWALTNSKQ